MKSLTLAMTFAAVCLAGALNAQTAPGPGDLVPRTGTLAYITSDKPEVLYRVFGKDADGGWRLRSWAQGMMDQQHEKEPDSEEAKRDRAVFEYVFGSYEALEKVEVGIVDVTMDGPKYLVHLKSKEGQSINIQPEFLKDFVAETQTFKDVKYVLYRGEDTDNEMPEEGDMEPGKDDKDPPRNAFGAGMDRFYVAKLPTGVLISNFETTIRDAIEKYASGDYSESLSGREEFKEWIGARTPHHLSVFIIGREIQNAIERVIPSEEQAGMDAEGVYREIDGWFQFREYKYVVFDMDYDEVARGVTVAASFKTRRQTRLLEKLAIEPAEFKLLKYVPEGAIMTAGMQIGDATTTFDNLKELAFDAEGWVKEVQEGFGGGRNGPMPPDDEKDPVPEEDFEPKTVSPQDWLKTLQDMAEEGDEGADEGTDEPSEVEKGLEEIKEMLAEYGTSLDEILGVLGTEVVVFATSNMQRASDNAYGEMGMDDVFKSADVGVAIAIKDVAKAKSIIATARENDPEGVFRGFVEIGFQGKMFNLSEDQPYGYCFTEDALLIAIAMGVHEEDATDSIIAGLKSMTVASSRTVTGENSFVKNGSKFLEVDVGAIARIEQEVTADMSTRLDRYAQPQLGEDPTSFITDLTVGLRTREHKDGVEIAVRVAGLPDLGRLLDSEISPFSRGGRTNQNAYSYTEENLRTLSRAMRRQAEENQAIDFDAMLKLEDIRPGTLQSPFDPRWQGELEKLGWTTLDQVVRDSEGNLPEWVELEAAEMIEANEKQGWKAFVLAEGDIAKWMEDYKSGFIVAYQEKPDTLGGHFVVYADNQIGWLHADVLAEALKLNTEGEPVPADDPWEMEEWEDGPDEGGGENPDEGDRIKEDDPWFPGGSK